MKAFALFLLCAMPAYAVGPPGPPPWQCGVWAACEGETCISLPAAPLGMKLFQIDDDMFRVEGQDGTERMALRADIPVQALNLISKGLPERISMYLRPSAKVADAHGFELYSVGRRGDGELVLSKSHALIACNSIR